MAARFVKLCAKGDLDGVWGLLQWEDFDVNSHAKYGMTPLMAAIIWKRSEVTRLLLERNDIDINQVDFSGQTVLHHAAWYGYYEELTMLLDDATTNSNTVNKMDIGGCTPLLLAVDGIHCGNTGAIKCVQILLNDTRTNPNIRTFYEGDSALMCAIKQTQLEVVKLLLGDPRTDLQTRDNYKRSQREITR